MQRRDFLKYSALLGAASALPLWSRSLFAATRPTLPIPPLLAPDAESRIVLTVQAGESQFAQKSATTWGITARCWGQLFSCAREKR